MRKRFIFFFLFDVLVCFIGCKKTSPYPYFIREKVGGITFQNCLAHGYLDIDSADFIYIGESPNQTCDAPREFAFHFKKELGTQTHDTTQLSASGIYMICYKNTLPTNVYSTYCTGTNTTITVTEIDDNAETIRGTFSGNLCAQDSSNDFVQITDGEFYIKYN